MLFTIATDLGLSAIVTRELVRDHSRRAEHLSTFLFIKVALLFTATLVIVLVVPHVGALPLSRSLMLSLAALVFFDSMRIIASTVNRAREAMHREAFINIFTQAVILAIGMLMLRVAPSAENLNIAYAVGSAVGTLYAFFLIRDHLPGILTSFRRPLVRELMRDSLPIAIVGLLGSLMLNTDIVMLGWMRTAAEIGYYSATQKIIFTLYVLPTLIASATFPAMTRLAHDMPEFKRFFEKTLKYSLMLALPITVGGIMTASQTIDFFYGAAYLPATASYVILLLTVPIAFTTSIINNALIARNSQKHFLTYASIGLISNVIFNFLLIPIWGINGTAVATFITGSIAGLFIWHRLNALSGFSLPHGLGKTIFACAIMGVIAYACAALGTNVLVTIFAGACSYVAALYALREPAFITLTKRLK